MSVRTAALLATAALASAAPAHADIGAAVPPLAVAPEAAPPVLLYVALALAAVAVLLGAAAVAMAWTTRDRINALAQTVRTLPPPRPDAQAAERLARLESAVRDLVGAKARQPEAAAPPARPAAERREPFPPAGRPLADPAPTLPVAASLPAWTEALTAAFARLARDPSSAAAGFIAEHRPQGAQAGPDGVALLDRVEDAKLWAVRAPGEADEVWALTPGEQAVMNWSAHFAPQRTEVAAEVFGAAFDLAPGDGALRMEAPALARRDASGRLSVRRRGRLSGFRS